MLYCEYCGGRMNDDAHFCPSCGASVSANTKKEKVESTSSSSTATTNTSTTESQTSTGGGILGTILGVGIASSILRGLTRHRGPMPPPPPRGPMPPPRGPRPPMGRGPRRK